MRILLDENLDWRLGPNHTGNRDVDIRKDVLRGTDE